MGTKKKYAPLANTKRRGIYEAPERPKGHTTMACNPLRLIMLAANECPTLDPPSACLARSMQERWPS